MNIFIFIVYNTLIGGGLLVVAVDERLKEIREGLRQKGYKVVSFAENIAVDAIVYYNDGSYRYQNGGQMSAPPILFSGGNVSNGTFLVNGYGKNLNEIDQILQHRSYSPLFGLE